MTLCGGRCVAGWSYRHNVKPRTPREAPLPLTWGGDGAPLVAPTSKWASVLLTLSLPLTLPRSLSLTLTLPPFPVLGSPAFWTAFGVPASPHRRGRSWG